MAESNGGNLGVFGADRATDTSAICHQRGIMKGDARGNFGLGNSAYRNENWLHQLYRWIEK